MTYEEQCTKYFAPLEEIDEAIRNSEGVAGISNQELRFIVNHNKSMRADLIEHTWTTENDLE